ncbi:hypothetical protein QWZ03_01780 [Chitinimonas viridis]|uniref:Uncharacterized protein n=1 Tax=Chitinimonas viridis TaxID=664880 RepID=A0ABT8B0Z3_9NEIS|nr:hypothetical protein [Chitinimonas viridis]MDN3575500.1 hypothetical protein [Chitinimonas viridis]
MDKHFRLPHSHRDIAGNLVPPLFGGFALPLGIRLAALLLIVVALSLLAVSVV